MKIDSFDFAYMIGNFLADGSFYKTKRGKNFEYRFEFTDGTPYENELKYSRKHLLKIKNIIEEFLNKKIPPLKKRGNRFVLSFRDKRLSELFLTLFNFCPGDKSKIVEIPDLYKNSKYEKYFWIGFLDGDGSIARKSRRIALESMSNNIINSFADFLRKNNILFSQYKSNRGEDYSYVILIRSVSFRDFSKKIGFIHPLKSKLLKEKLKDRDFFIKNKIKMKDGIIRYDKIFNDSVFVERGRELFVKYGNNKYHKPNVKLNEIISLMKNKGIKIEKILEEINEYRFKKGKGSKYSVKLPLFFSENILKIGKLVRLRDGGISFSKVYTNSFNEDFEEILKTVKNTFDINPIYTCKNEPIFCSGVLKDFFSAIVNRS